MPVINLNIVVTKEADDGGIEDYDLVCDRCMTDADRENTAGPMDADGIMCARCGARRDCKKTVECWFCGHSWEVEADVNLPLCPECMQGEGEEV